VNGEWILIDGANRCSAAVLDRLNSLMEPSGSLLLSERGCIDGNIIEIKPHPEFRLILALDPVYGEISR
jgi:midasin